MKSKYNNQESKSSLEKRIKNLLLENEKLKQELHDLNRKLQKTELFKTHFISNITNELINPFTSILGLSKTILSVKKEEWKKVISMVALIHSEAFVLDYQLKNIFTAAKIEAGIEIPQAVKLDVKNFIENIKELFKLESRKRNINIIYHYNNDLDNQYFITDSEKLKIIISNIINNALKFSDEGSKVHVYCELINKKLIIKVKDEGIGIPKENFNIIFDRFERLNNNINSIDHGQGLGLSVSISLLDMIGGKIELKSRVKEGSVFTVEIPEMDEESSDISISDGELFFNDSETF